ncbi:hypothetical protein DM02DRAFT_722947 [Periconia macrospinosa]|uniref:Uncharacterized protein n=1 Tax=Periconia macrospinosa TaxID=97972 RepID=A0A2V1EFK7_9PLEO|nr:hypothetical protein DM02DRAFT_722947 [Periconia macrospinosa]
MSAQAKGKAPVRPNMPSTLLEMDVTEGLRTLVVDSSSETDEDEPAQQPRLRQLSVKVPARVRPSLGRKAATAPPGALYIYKHAKPYVPRRAISEKAEHGKSSFKHRQEPKHKMTPPIPRLPPSITLPTKSFVIGKMLSRNSIEKAGSKSNRQVWRLSPQASSHLRSISEALGDRKKPLEVSSFSEKERVKETLDRKKLDSLRTTSFVDFKSKDLPGTPLSMVSTPRELYGSQYDYESARPSPTGPRLDIESPLLPTPQTSPKTKHFSLPLTPQVQRRMTMRRSSSEPKPESSPEKKTVYIPGPIRIVDRIVATPRKGSIASLESFAQPYSPAKPFSDHIALDSVACFFEELGVMEESSEEGFDLYWLAEEKCSERITRDRKGASSVPAGRPFSPAPSSPRPSMQAEQRYAPSLEIRGRRRLRSLLRSSRSIR